MIRTTDIISHLDFYDKQDSINYKNKLEEVKRVQLNERNVKVIESSHSNIKFIHLLTTLTL